MSALIILALLVLLALAAPRWGADTHRSREWDDPIESPRSPDHLRRGAADQLRPAAPARRTGHGPRRPA